MSDHVKHIGDQSVRVIVQSPETVQVIRQLRGVFDAGANEWRIDYDREDELAAVLQALRDTGLAFAGGSSGWPPAAVADLLREKGKLRGLIKEITWSGPGQETVREI